MLMLMLRLSSLAHKLLNMLMFMLMLVSLVRTRLKAQSSLAWMEVR